MFVDQWRHNYDSCFYVHIPCKRFHVQLTQAWRKEKFVHVLFVSYCWKSVTSSFVPHASNPLRHRNIQQIYATLTPCCEPCSFRLDEPCVYVILVHFALTDKLTFLSLFSWLFFPSREYVLSLALALTIHNKQRVRKICARHRYMSFYVFAASCKSRQHLNQGCSFTC